MATIDSSYFNSYHKFGEAVGGDCWVLLLPPLLHRTRP